MIRSTLFFLFLAAAVQAQNFAIGYTEGAWNDPARNRDVDYVCWYPADAAGQDVAVAQGSFPVVVLAHGFLTGTAPYQNVADSLVPLGYILLLPATETGFTPSHAALGQDMVFLAERIQQAHGQSSSMWFGKVNPRMAAAGHSMGGGATYLATSQPQQPFTCSFTFAAAETSPSSSQAGAQVTIPSLLLAGSEDGVTPPATTQQPIYNNLAGCKVMYSINGGGHCYFMNPDPPCDFGELATPPSLDRTSQQIRAFRVLRPWLATWLKDSSGTAVEAVLNSPGTDAVQQNCNTLSTQNVGEVSEWLELRSDGFVWKKAGNYSLQCLDMNGRVVYATDTSAQLGDFFAYPKNLARGVYVWTLAHEGEWRRVKTVLGKP